MSVIDELYALAEKLNRGVETEVEEDNVIGFYLDLSVCLTGATYPLGFSVTYKLNPPEGDEREPSLEIKDITLMNGPFDETQYACKEWRYDSLGAYFQNMLDSSHVIGLNGEAVEGLQQLIRLTEE